MLRPKLAALNPRMKFLPLLLFASLACSSASAPSRDWQIEIKTDGGFTGRGVGSVTVTADMVAAKDFQRPCDREPSEEERERFARLVVAADPERWQESYRRKENPGYADQIRYTLRLVRGEDERSVFWYDETMPQLPKDLRALHDAAWTARRRAIEECGK